MNKFGTGQHQTSKRLSVNGGHFSDVTDNYEIHNKSFPPCYMPVRPASSIKKAITKRGIYH